MWEHLYIFTKLPPPHFAPWCCLQPLFECHQISSVILTIWYNATLEKNTLCLSHCVCFMLLFLFLFILSKGSSYLKFSTFHSWKLFYFATRVKQKGPSNVHITHTDISKWAMPHVNHFFFFFFFCCFSLHSNCSEIWGLSSPNTIEQWDTSGLYNYPDQTRWLFSTIVRCRTQLWCGRFVPVFHWRWQTAILSYSWPHYCLFLFHLLSNQIPGRSPAGLPT